MSKLTQRTTLQILSLSIGLLFFAACRAPAWCTSGALRCIPQTADSSAKSYWDNCETGQSSQTRSIPDSPLSRTQDDAVSQTLPPENSSNGTHTNLKLRLAGYSLMSATDEPEPQADELKSSKPSPFQLPPALPGADTPPLVIPKPASKPEDKVRVERERAAAFSQLYPAIPALEKVPGASPDSASGQLGLEELQTIARQCHPELRAKAAAVEAARGLMIQAGLPPNPTVGYQADTVRTLFTQGYQGAYIQQTFVTAQKLGLAAQAAAADHANAYLDLQKTWYTVISEVRRQYFRSLAARQRLQLAEALSELSERAYQTQIELVKAGEAAPYEPLQLHVLTTQSRATFFQAQQDALAAWRALAAAIGQPDLPPTMLAGRIDCQVPIIQYEEALQRLLIVHTDLQTAKNLVSKNKTLVTLADRTPIPNLNAGVVVQHDDTFEPGTTTYNLMLGGAVPIFDRNQGNRVATRAELVRASQNVTSTTNQLTSQLALSFAGYESNRKLAASFRNDALSDQVRAYRGIYQRYHADPTSIGFNDIIVAQQTLAATLTQYLTILQSQWEGAINVAELLQVDDLFQLGPQIEVAQFPDVTSDLPTTN